MVRPRHEQPTPAELEILKILWEKGALSVREVLAELQSHGDGRAYTSVMSLMNVMAEKRLLRRKAAGRAFIYSARDARAETLGQLIGDLCERAFAGSAKTLVAHLLQESQPNSAELEEIRQAIEAFQQREAPPS